MLSRVEQEKGFLTRGKIYSVLLNCNPEESTEQQNQKTYHRTCAPYGDLDQPAISACAIAG